MGEGGGEELGGGWDLTLWAGSVPSHLTQSS